MKLFKKMEQLQIQILFILFLAIGLAASTHRRQNRDAEVCNIEDPTLKNELKRCMKKGDRFVKKYFNALSRKKNRKQGCSLFTEAHACFQELFSKCAAARNVLSPDWLAVYDVMACQCSNESEECAKAVNCFEVEHVGVLSVRCDNYLVFNQRQKTRHHCHFVHENIQCKQALVASACGNYSGEFAFHLYKYKEEKHLGRPRHCPHLHKDAPYKGFRYSEHCSRHFVNELLECEQYLLQNGVVEAFLTANDLVFADDADAVHSACRDYKKYEECRQPIKDRCPHGVKILEDYYEQIRTVRMKLRFICEEKKDAYVENLPCYQQVINNGSLKVCNGKYEALKPVMEDVIAHQFYCQRNSNGTQKLLTALGDLRICYEETFVGACGNEGGTVMSGLMTEAFQDPLYLRYSYEPDCSLHTPEENELAASDLTTSSDRQDDQTRPGRHRDRTTRGRNRERDTTYTQPTRPQTKRPRKDKVENEVLDEPEVGHRKSSASCVSTNTFLSTFILTLNTMLLRLPI